jgi:AcrR family transcriptional regulator
MGLRERKKEHQRRDILEAALALFRERGYDGTRVQDIIEQVGISEGTFFNYFPTKDSILHEFAIDHIDLYRGILEYELDSRDRSVPDRIREIMRAAAQAIEQDREFQAVLYTRSNLFDAHGLLKEKTLRSYDLLTELFRSGQERGEIRHDIDPLQLAETMTGIYHLTTLNWLTNWFGNETDALEPRLGRAIDLFLDGCRPPRSESA